MNRDKKETSLEAFLASGPFPLSKNPGLHPVRVCEVLQRKEEKMVMKIAKEDNNNKTVGSLQSCEGQVTGSKVAIHTDLNRGGIADFLLLGTILAICQKSLDPSFWEVIDSLLC